MASPASTTSRVERRLFRLSDAAWYAGTTVWFWRTQIWAGNIPYLRLGKRHLLDRADIDSFLETLKKEGDKA